tara:strand:- start:82 stop:234 length:153 start_codon:yes stop_codon:yes gene_type:complete
MTPIFLNKYETEPELPKFPENLEKTCLTSATVLFLLSVTHSTIIATPDEL